MRMIFSLTVTLRILFLVLRFPSQTSLLLKVLFFNSFS